MAIDRRGASALVVVLTVLAIVIASLGVALYPLTPRSVAFAQEDEATPTAEASPSASPAGTPVAAEAERQVFAAGPWRMTIVSARFGDAIPEVDLSDRSGRDWAVAVLDVTNWSEEEADLRWRDFGIRVAGGEEGQGFAPQTTEDVAATLGVQPGDAGEEYTFDAGGSERVALVFQIDDGGRRPALAFQSIAVPLATSLDASPDPQSLPPVSEAPEFESMPIVSVSDGETIRVGEGNGERVRLAGVDAPDSDECFGSESADRLEDLAGQTVLIERAPDDPDGPAYVWVENGDNVRLLLNYEMIAGGFAAATAAEASRFRSWLAEADHRARYGGLGLWSACTGPHGVTRPDEPEPTVLEIGVDGQAEEYEVWVSWAPEIVGTPDDGGAWAFFSGFPQDQGDDADRQLYASRYDPTTGEWSRATPMPGGRVQFGASAVVDADGRVHVVYSDRQADEEDEPSVLVYVAEDGDGGWTEPVPVASERTAGHQISPSLTIDQSGVLHVLWQDQRAWEASDRIASTSNADVFASQRAPGGTWSEPVMVNEHQVGQAGLHPRIAADGDRLVAVWSIYTTALGTGTAARIEWATRALDDPEAEWGEPETLLAGRGESFGGRLIDLEADPTGGVVMAFGRQANDTFLFVRRLDPGETEWSGDMLITFGLRGTFPSLAINHIGTVFVAYNLGEGALVDVGATAIAHGSVNPGPEVNLTAEEPETQGLPTVAIDHTGAPWLIYFNQTPDGVPNGAKVQSAPFVPLS